MPSTYRVMIVDDERIARAGLRAILSTHRQLTVVGEARDGSEAIRMIGELRPDIVFVDIRMPGPDGFAVVRQLSVGNRKPAFVFVTAYPTRALDAYDADAVDYLLKPFNEARLFRSVSRAIRYLRGVREPRFSGKRLLVRTENGSVFVDVDDIVMAQVDGNYLRLRTRSSSEHFVRQTLSSFGKDLRAGFLRVSRSAIVNVAFVRAMTRLRGGRFAFELHDGTRVISSRRYQRQVRAAIRLS